MVAGTIEKIQIELKAVTTGFANGLNKAQTQLKAVGKNMQKFGQVMQMPMQNFKELNGEMEVMQGIGGKVAKRFRLMTHGMRGFRMEALGVMFFGMMMQRMFMGLLQPVMEAFGVFDLFRVMLLTLFLPVMEIIFPFLMNIMEWFMNLPEPVKKAIGIFVILGAIFGTIIMVLGQFALGIGSLIQFFPIFGGAIKAVGGILAGVSAVFLAVVAVVIAIAVGMWVAWKENFMNMKKFTKDFVDNIKKMFGALWMIIKSIFGFWIALFKGDWDGAWEHIKNGFKAMWTFIKNILLAFLNFSAMVAAGVIRIFKWIVDGIVGFFKWLYNKIVGRSIIPDMIKAIISWFWKLPKAIFDMWKSVVSGMFNIGKNLIQGIINGIKSIGRRLINAILNLFPSWMRRGIEAAGRITINIVKSITEKVKSVFSGGRKNDFIWRPGQSPISINPNDTLVGFKGAPPGLEGGGGSIVQENHFHGFTMDDLRRELDDRDRRLVDDVRRLVKE